MPDSHRRDRAAYRGTGAGIPAPAALPGLCCSCSTTGQGIGRNARELELPERGLLRAPVSSTRIPETRQRILGDTSLVRIQPHRPVEAPGRATVPHRGCARLPDRTRAPILAAGTSLYKGYRRNAEGSWTHEGHVRVWREVAFLSLRRRSGNGVTRPLRQPAKAAALAELAATNLFTSMSPAASQETAHAPVLVMTRRASFAFHMIMQVAMSTLFSVPRTSTPTPFYCYCFLHQNS